MSCQQVPTTPAFNPYPRSVQVGEFEVAIGGGICVAIRDEWHFGMKAHIGVDADSVLVHTVIGTSGNVADVVEGNSLLHVQETDGFGDASKTAAITSSENLGPVALTNQSCSGHP